LFVGSDCLLGAGGRYTRVYNRLITTVAKLPTTQPGRRKANQA